MLISTPKCLSTITCAIGLLILGAVARGDFGSEGESAASALQAVMPRAQVLVDEGKVDEGNSLVLETFPEKTRTPTQAFMLGNVLFSQDPKKSYELHKLAAQMLPQESDVQLEWAMEQHRAGEYAGAADSYATFAKANSNSAVAYGLMAECLIRTGKTKQAVDAWQASEKAPGGTIEKLESLVCEVNAHRYPYRERAEWLNKAKAGNIEAAEQLMALDLAFPKDWWNVRPNVAYLNRDIALLRKTTFEDKRIAEILCAGDCALAADAKNPIAPILRKAGFLLDDKTTFPQSGTMMSAMLLSAITTGAITKADARAKWGETLLQQITTSKDKELINVAANLYLDTDKLQEIDARGWDAAGDERFAVSLIFKLAEQGKLKLDDPLLAKAVKEFPENALLAGIVVHLSEKENKPLRAALINAIKAEYTHFSPQPISGRAGAAALRHYFSMLAKFYCNRFYPDSARGRGAG